MVDGEESICDELVAILEASKHTTLRKFSWLDVTTATNDATIVELLESHAMVDTTIGTDELAEVDRALHWYHSAPLGSSSMEE